MIINSFTSRDGFIVTPSDTVDLPREIKALYIGTTGNLKVTFESDAVVDFPNVPVGIFPVRVKRVWSTGTSAADIRALCE